MPDRRRCRTALSRISGLHQRLRPLAGMVVAGGFGVVLVRRRSLRAEQLCDVQRDFSPGLTVGIDIRHQHRRARHHGFVNRVPDLRGQLQGLRLKEGGGE